MSKQREDELPPVLQEALNSGLLQRLPLTFLPFTRQQLREWPYLFPYERQSILRLLLFVAGLRDDEVAQLFHEVYQLEDKMGVRKWQFSSEQQTILNASLLARSPYYQDWRKAVQKIFDIAEQYAQSEKSAASSVNRCIVVILPAVLKFDPTKIWQQWQGIGHPADIESSERVESPGYAELLLRSRDAGGESLLRKLIERSYASLTDVWFLDAEENLVGCVSSAGSCPDTACPGVLLSHSRLATFRKNFLQQINTMRKDLADADAVYDRLRQTDVTLWCPPEIVAQPVIREYLRSLYLSGNGALLFGNSFVEWGASEALRRARPTFLMAQFGVRSRPKPFTSVAVFENQDEINPLPTADDLPGSALDAQQLALYVWLAVSRYDEYQHNTLFLCIAESLSQAYVVAPPECGLNEESISVAKLSSVLNDWISSKSR